jgi:hypothetical protein
VARSFETKAEAEQVADQERDYNYVIFDDEDVAIKAMYSLEDDRKTIEENWPDDPPEISRPEWSPALEKYEQHTSAAALMKHPDYEAAKRGDLEAARRVADKFFKEDKLTGLVDNAPAGAPIIVVPVVAEEAMGDNRLPYALAEKISKYTGWPLEEEIRQIKQAEATQGPSVPAPQPAGVCRAGGAGRVLCPCR